MFDELSTRSKLFIAFAGAMLLLAGARIYSQIFGEVGESKSEFLESVAGQSYAVHCQACEARYQMPAADYLEAADDRDGDQQGIPCRACGAREAFREGFARESRPPTDLAGRVASLTVADVEAAMEQAHAEVKEIDLDLVDPAITADSPKSAELAETRRRLVAELDWLNRKWEELARRGAGS